ncbi:conserved hypothetical protein [Ricinus communis]|uniref:Uncharacterized protein n=1 Tax=Ricinus communis TaxID=3988 RepID=B9S3I4_RICCO|nr:conserved hypothetical protein [Ricinus communis]
MSVLGKIQYKITSGMSNNYIVILNLDMWTLGSPILSNVSYCDGYNLMGNFSASMELTKGDPKSMYYSTTSSASLLLKAFWAICRLPRVE